MKRRTFQFHSSVETFVKSAGWTLFASGDRNGTIGTSKALVVFLILHCPLEEALAAFARKNAIMKSRYLVATNRTWTEEQEQSELKPKYYNIKIAHCLKITQNVAL